MRWSILIPTLAWRRDKFVPLVEALLTQMSPYGPDIELVALFNHAERSIGLLRHQLLHHARGDYISFIDDDDTVPDYHCAEIMAALDGPVVDQIGFQVEVRLNAQAPKLAYHSMRYTWGEDEAGYYRPTSHLNPMRARLARTGNFRGLSNREDAAWINQVTRRLHTETYIDRVMYHYRWSEADSVQNGSHHPHRPAPDRPVIGHPQFHYHPASTA